MIKFNGKAYKLNLEKICQFAVAQQSLPAEREIIDSYNSDGNTTTLSQKTIREFQSYSYDSVKYDLIKSVVFQLLSYDFTEEMSETAQLPIGMSVCLNTLVDDGYLIEINKK